MLILAEYLPEKIKDKIQYNKISIGIKLHSLLFIITNLNSFSYTISTSLKEKSFLEMSLLRITIDIYPLNLNSTLLLVKSQTVTNLILNLKFH